MSSVILCRECARQDDPGTAWRWTVHLPSSAPASRLVRGGRVAEDGPARDADPGGEQECPPASRPRSSARGTCLCGHPKKAHEHYRRGTDCALCDCPRYTSRLLAWITRRRR